MSSSNQQESFPELVGRTPQEAADHISRRGLMPIIVKVSQPITMDYCASRVRIITDEQGTSVLIAPTIG
ncbi:unnamed protein product [Adineta steineri]|uniref:Uncharacterized protein n=1 Tax=Adineta steineri TaxID=433720 RepID=A0A818Q122_9BILA|nr:unnamed protein product [Adineta steineri]CAF3630520.1 unnamed protein product [Adineta steineri]